MSALTTFIKNQTPSTAVALAIEDHKGGGAVDWPFVDQLNKAVERLNHHEELVAALKGATDILQQLYDQGVPVQIELNEARAILAKVTK